MKVLFHHEPFDVDVSSGTEHAAFQWMELFRAMGMEGAAVINVSGLPYPQVDSDFMIEELSSPAQFLKRYPEARVLGTGRHGRSRYRDFKYAEYDWIEFGGAAGCIFPAEVSIETFGGRDLYPREAAAIILGEMAWLSR